MKANGTSASATCHFSHALDEVPFALRCLSQQLLAQPQLTSVLFATSAIRMKANGSSAFASCHFSNALDDVYFALRYPGMQLLALCTQPQLTSVLLPIAFAYHF